MGSRHFFEFGAFRLDPGDRVLLRDGQLVPLTPKGLETLVVLVERHGRLVTKDELFRLVWPEVFVEENNLAQHISTLRRVLGNGASGSPFIETVPKRGYRFVGAVVERHEDDGTPDTSESPAPPIVPAEMATAPAPLPGGRPLARLATIGAVAAVVAAAAGFGAFRWTREAGSRSPKAPSSAATRSADPAGADGVTRIAVLPFQNLGSSAEKHFVDGMTEEISSRLAGLSRVAVPSSTTIAGYDQRGKDLRRIGAELGVAYVVEGSAQWVGANGTARVRITPRLIRVADDTVVWTKQYEGSAANVFAVQADIAQQIAGALRVVLDARDRQAVEARPTSDVEAYLAYLRGVAIFQQAASDTANQAQARVELERAVGRDPQFALAWSWLARVYAMQYAAGARRNPGVREAAYQAGRRAVQIDPDRPEMHLGLAHVLMIDQEHERALRELDLAGDGAPNSPARWVLIGTVKRAQGHWADSLTAYMRAFEGDPATTAEHLVLHYLHQRQYDEARRFIEIAKAANRTAVVVPEAWMLFSERGEVDGARAVLERALVARSPADSRVRGLLAYLEWIDGRHQRALELIADMDPAGAWLPANFRFPSAVLSGLVYESMGRRAEARGSFAAATADLRRRRADAADDYQIEAALGMAMAGLGEETTAVRHAERAVSLLPVSKEAATGPLYLYLLAQTNARLGRRAAAVEALDQLFSVPGFYSEHWVRRDPGFASLRTDPSFGAHLERWSRQKGEILLAHRTGPPN
jgi:DNA-binding winged helix-turn-helix (wHTH) protein/TolB-like protein/cytochrome c-type biogenesis protein CcmH/NrfG